MTKSIRNPNTLISIITPSYNSEIYIEDTIQSIKNQTYKNIEHIIIDGDSTDKTIKIIKNYPNVKFISEPDNGMYDAINKGLKIAQGDILAYLNSDDLYLPDTIKTAVECFQENSDLDIIYGDCRIIDEKGRPLYIHKAPEFDWDFFINRHSLLITQPTAFWTKSSIKKYGYFDTSYNYSSDYDFFMKVFAGKKVKHTGKIMAEFRSHQNAISQKMMMDMKNENFHIWRKWEKDRQFTKRKLSKSIKLRLQNYHLLLQKEYWKAIFIKLKTYKDRNSIPKFKS